MRARNSAAFIKKEQRLAVINRALIQDTNIEIIISNEDGYVTMINRVAEKYLEVDAGAANGRLLAELQRNLAPQEESASEFFRIIQGVRLHCTQKNYSLKVNL